MYEEWLAACVDCDGSISNIDDRVYVVFSQNKDGQDLLAAYEERVNKLGCKTGR